MQPLQICLFLCIIFMQANPNLAAGELYKPAEPISCSNNQKCPTEWPCCSPYGQCGSGPVCVGGCNPLYSFEKESCGPLPALIPDTILEFVPTPVLDPQINSLENELLNRNSIDFTKYLVTSDLEAAQEMMDNVEFTFSGPLKLDDSTGNLLLTMPKLSFGTLVASTKSFLYGKSTIRLKSGRSRGVITSIVLISSVGDEVDFEFLGSELEAVQTNYFFRGALLYTHMQYANVSSSTYDEFHDYGFDWNKERIHWLIDGIVVRTLFRDDTWDEKTQTFKYPETPMRLEVGLWPGGAETNHPGTIEWAGGKIDWENSTDIIENGQFSAEVSHISLEPYFNDYSNDMWECLSLGRKTTYEYISTTNLSLKLYCGLVPNIPGWRSSGSSVPRNFNPLQSEVQLHNKRIMPVLP